MKRLSIAIAVLMLIALLVPTALAYAETTDVTVATGGGATPIVKCKWEQEPITCLESNDPSHSVPLSQFNPPMVKCTTKTIDYYAVVTDLEEGGNVYEVFAYVYHPVNSPAPYNAAYDPDGAYARFKYKVVFERIDDQVAAASLINAADAAHLITFASPYTIEELTGANGEITKGTAKLWKGTAEIDYEQPGGYYDVRVWGVDHNNNRSQVLYNQFLYAPTSGIEVDFTGIVYGSVNLGVEKLIAGDYVWGSGLAGEGQVNKATVRNIGNMWAHVTVQQNDMGFGFAGVGPGTALVSSSPLGAASNWNVNFDLRLGSDNAFKQYYDPNVLVTTPNFLGLSTKDELDFSILVKNGFDHHTGTITLGSTIEPFGTGGAGNANGPVGVADPCPT